MKRTVCTLVAAAMATSAWFAYAQEGGERQRGGRDRGGRGNFMARLPLYKALDKDEDGTLSEEEIKNASAALLTLDKDGDGKLSSEEMMPAFGGRRGGDRPGVGGAGRQRGGGDGERPRRPDSAKEDAES